MADGNLRCQSHYKNSNWQVVAGERCNRDAAMEVHIDTVNLPVLLCDRHYAKWTREPISKVARWRAVEVKKRVNKETARGVGKA